ncbi:TPA: hypothetical protein ACTUT5_002888 [Legionella anisa]|uniref:hypothetical protein n=1 Tax=Legionella anisa TaxID=28082 RepID=UPI00197FFCBC|nr:hypothetical protein [Legionella anisa]MBN5937078.1 hypothetical protein [Legionella anisa]
MALSKLESLNDMELENWEDIEWTKLGGGAYNDVYRSGDGKHVFKIQHAELDDLARYPDVPERSVRLWNEINPDLPAFLAVTQYGKGWICPFVYGVEPSDEEMSRAVIDIFNKTGRILADAPGQDNFKKTPDGRVVCIDIGMALKIDAKDKQLTIEQLFTKHLTGVKSETSAKTWRITRSGFETFFPAAAFRKPITVNTIQALYFIAFYRPNISNVNFFNNSPDLVLQLAKGYKGEKIADALAALDRETTVKASAETPISTKAGDNSEKINIIESPDATKTPVPGSLSLKEKTEITRTSTGNYGMFKPQIPNVNRPAPTPEHKKQGVAFEDDPNSPSSFWV